MGASSDATTDGDTPKLKNIIHRKRKNTKQMIILED